MKALAGLVSGESWLPGSLMASFSLCPYLAEGSLWSLLYKGSNVICVGSACMTKRLLKLPHPNAMALGIRFYHMNLEGT